jgi:hypothetical protein
LESALEDYKESFAFDFGYDKQSRENYPLSQPKAHMVDNRLISREELIKRSWHEGNYLQEVADFYGSERPVQRERPRPRANIVISAPPQPELDVVAQKSDEKKEPPTQDNRDFLMQKRKEFNRTRFLKNLETLIQNLVRRSDVHSQHQRKRGIAMVSEFLEIIKEATLRHALYRIFEYV